MEISFWRKNLFRIFALVPAAMLAVVSGTLFAASPNAANKVHVSGSTALAVGPAAVTLSSTTLKTSDKADVLVEFNGECLLGMRDFDSTFLSVSTVAQDTFGANDIASDLEVDNFVQVVQVWVEIDGVPVPVDPSAEELDNGRVNFCSQRHSSTTFDQLSLASRIRSDSTSTSTSVTSTNCDVGTTFLPFGLSHDHACFASSSTTTFTNTDTNSIVFTDIDIQEFSSAVQQTANANSFRWFAFDLGAGQHTIEVKAVLTEGSFSSSGGDGLATVVGRRTTVVSPLNNLQ